MKQKISSLQVGEKFKLTSTSPVFVVMPEKDGKIGYRHSVTDFPDKTHFYCKPDLMVIKIK